jgi:hypothetical protein
MKLQLTFLDENRMVLRILTIEYDKEAHQYLIQKAIETIILEYIEQHKEEKDTL